MLEKRKKIGKVGGRDDEEGVGSVKRRGRDYGWNGRRDERCKEDKGKDR